MTQFSKEMKNIRLTDLEKLTIESFVKHIDKQGITVWSPCWNDSVQSTIYDKENFVNFDYYGYLVSFHLDRAEYAEMVELNTKAYYDYLQNSIDKEQVNSLKKSMEEIIHLDWKEQKAQLELDLVSKSFSDFKESHSNFIRVLKDIGYSRLDHDLQKYPAFYELTMKTLANNNTTHFYDVLTFSVSLAILFLLVNFIFKLTGSPFHIWAPSVYDNAPLLSSTFLSIFSKMIILSFLITTLLNTFSLMVDVWQWILLFSSLSTILVSIVGAISERVLKRFYVYSSMTHIGFMFLGILSGTTSGLVGTLNYLMVYVLSSLFMWIFLFFLSKNLTHITNLKLIANHSPILGFMFSIIMFSTAGIPPLSGFFVKFDILQSLLFSSFYYIAFLVLLFSVLTFFYYLRLVKIVYFESKDTFLKIYNFNSKKMFILTYLFLFLTFYIFYIQYIDNYMVLMEITND